MLVYAVNRQGCILLRDEKHPQDLVSSQFFSKSCIRGLYIVAIAGLDGYGLDVFFKVSWAGVWPYGEVKGFAHGGTSL